MMSSHRIGEPGNSCVFRESYGHGAEAGAAGWGKALSLPQLLVGRGSFMWTCHSPVLSPSPPPMPGLAAIFPSLSPILV